MDLILCEKPSQGAAFAAALGVKERGNGFMKGNGYTITWCIGHVMGMAEPEFYDPKYKKWVYDDLPIFPAQFKLQVTKEKRAQYNVVVGLLKKASRCIIATDFDREGEAIAREVIDSIKFNGSILRIKCSSYESSDIRAAMRSLLPSTDTITKYYAQIGRMRADWLVGMNLSRMVGLAYRSHKSGAKLSFSPSVGRVQTPMINICVLREKAIRNFIPKDYYQVGMNFSSASGDFTAVLQIPEEYQNELGGLDDHNDAHNLAEQLNGGEGFVSQFSSKVVKENAPLLFIPSSLSVEAEKIGISTANTKSDLQVLYESGLVTYPRTDNPYLPKSMIPLVPDIFCQLSSTGIFDAYLGLCDASRVGKCWKDVDAADAAHHGIVPTVKAPNRDKLTVTQTQIYDLICIRYLQQFMQPRELSEKEVVIEVGGLSFIGRSKQETKSGWFASQKTHCNETDEDEISESKPTRALPDLHQNDYVVCREGYVITKKKTKPQRFTEATLLVEMSNASKYLSDPNLKLILKKTGLGTEATQSDILNNELRKKNLIIKNRKIHVPAEVEAFIDFVPEDIKKVDTTALWEEMLALIESGELALEDFMSEIKSYIEVTIRKYRV